MLAELKKFLLKTTVFNKLQKWVSDCLFSGMCLWNWNILMDELGFFSLPTGVSLEIIIGLHRAVGSLSD